jgi:2-oxoglutarate dehydrogenase E1 component
VTKDSKSLGRDFAQSMALFGENAVMLEEIYAKYLNNPKSVDASWQQFFAQYPKEDTGQTKTTAQVIGVGDVDASLQASVNERSNPSLRTDKVDCRVGSDEPPRNDEAQSELIKNAYRNFGHFLAKLDPLGLEKLPSKIEALGFELPEDSHLDKIYCSSIGAEFAHITDHDERNLLFEQFETSFQAQNITPEEQKRTLENLVRAEGFEQFLHTKFPGAKRFSVEGGEGLIVALNRIVENFANQGAEVQLNSLSRRQDEFKGEVAQRTLVREHDRDPKNSLVNGLRNDAVIGMAHRGRLNTLANVIGKPYKAILSEFLGTSSFPPKLGVAGDVKYHMGYENKSNNIILSLAANPSHLEAVNSVVAGNIRAKQDALPESSKASAVGILIHGDAAFCGQGVVAENMVMGPLRAYNVRGIIHIIINNQIGFTANPEDAHTGRYVTEVAKIAGAPILHVNGDDAEAILRAADFALNYRNKFGKDVVIDIICYRKYGHNEGDEPAYTQVLMYKAISNKQTPGAVYANKLVQQGVVAPDFFDNLKKQFKELLDGEYLAAKDYKPAPHEFNEYSKEIPATGVKKPSLQDLGAKLSAVPGDFALHPKLKTLLDQRAKDIKEDKPLDWASAETLAYASLLIEGKRVRLVGQDSGRGTFSHRHSVLYDQANGNKYLPLNNLRQSQAEYFVADSNLSEYAALGFEYGYSIADPNNLVIWEAQFGDFANGAQVMIDQFISSGKTKWLQNSSLVMLLPHGYEGQGPEHSSAKLERFLALAAENNLYITYPTTPASIFHLLRRQIYSENRLPLIVMSPKSLLRNKLAVSNLADLDLGTKFIPILDDNRSGITASKIEKIICCSGKIYYDLLEAAIKSNIINTAIIRLEQIYPFAKEEMMNIISKYPAAKEFIWAQEEPANMGAWSFIAPYLNDCLSQGSFKYIGRVAASSPACGYLSMHNAQQKQLIRDALNLKE